MGVGQDWVCFDVEKEYGGKGDEVIWSHRPKKQHEKSLIQGEMEGKRPRGRPHTCKELVKTGQSWSWRMHPNWQTIESQ